MKPMIRIHNLQTDEIIDREMTDNELSDYETQQLLNEAEQAEIQAKAQQKKALLSRLGITAEEAKLLLN